MSVPILPVLPILLPFLCAILCLIFRQRILTQRYIGSMGALIQTMLCYEVLSRVKGGNIIVTYAGNWVPPFGISMVVDSLSATLTFTTSIIGLAVMIYARADIHEDQIRRGFYPLVFLLLMGVNGAFLTGDIFNLYVWFEVMLISSFSLLVLGRKKEQIQAAIPYVIINLIKTLFFLASVGLLYGTLGTLNMADLHLVVQDMYATGHIKTLQVIAVMLMLAFGIKAGMFPLYFWLPASYHTPSPAIGALFAALLTKVGVYAMLRTFTIVLPLDEMQLMPLLGVFAIATMLIPILGAMAERNLRRILAFCLLSHIGIMLSGLAIFDHAAFSGMIFYMIHHMITIACLFFLSGILIHLYGSDDIRNMGGLMELAPRLAWLLLVPIIALSGLPPLSGFWGKMLLVKGALEEGHTVITSAILLASLLTLYTLLRLWHMVAWRKTAVSIQPFPAINIKFMTVATAALAAISLWMGLFPDTVATLSHQIATMLLDPSIYVDSVTGGTV